MSIRNTINKFYNSVDSAKQILDSYRNTIEERQKNIYDCVLEIVEEYEEENTDGSKIKELCRKKIEKTNKEINTYIKNLSRYIEKKEFVNKFEKSVLLIVFADVKSGKSTLGNFMSGYYLKDTSYDDLYKRPEFWIYDYSDKNKSLNGEKRIDDDYFREDEIEATATIQYYTINGGLTWVDTPGIGSLTRENEELAEEYTKFADMILFLTPSNSPCKQDEAYQIKKLIMKEKPLLITITKSDQKVKKVIGGKVKPVTIAKTMDNRNAQEDYLSQEISKMGGNNILSTNKYISISTQLAKEAVKEADEEKFIESNLPLFYEMIGDVISKKALELKMKRPKDEINSVIDDIVNGCDTLGGLNVLHDELKGVVDEIDKYKKLIDERNSVLLSEVKSLCMTDIYSSLRANKYQDLLNDSEKITMDIKKIIKVNFSKCLNSEISKILEDFNEREIGDFNFNLSAKFERKIETLEYQTLEMRVRKREPRGIIENIEHFFLGTEFSETSAKKRTHTKEIEVGDNFNEFVQQVWEDIEKSLTSILDKEMDIVKKEYFETMENKLEGLIGKIEKATRELAEYKF